MKGFREIEHTADIGIEVWGNNLETLFLNAAQGMYSIVFGELKNTAKDCFSFSVNEENTEDLLVAFLSELNYYLIVRKQYFTNFRNIKITSKENMYRLSCEGEIFDLSAGKDEQITEIKSVTYHQLKVEKKEEGYYTRIIFDI